MTTPVWAPTPSTTCRSAQRQPLHRSSAAFLRRADPSAVRLLSPARDSVLQGNSAVRLNGALATVSSWSDTSITITIPAGASSGPLLVSVAPGMNSSNPVTFTVTAAPPPNYTLSALPNGVTLVQGSSGTSTITVTPQNGFSGSVNLSASGLPSGVT